MACRTLFINSEDFKGRVDISENVESRYVTPYIGVAQDRYLKSVLCKDFYDEIEGQVVDDTLTTANRTLLNDYIKPALVYRTYEQYIVYSNYKSTPAGVRVLGDEDSNAASDRALESMSKMAASNAKHYENAMLDYLEDNKDNYPTWRDNCKCKEKESTSQFKISSVGSKKPKHDYYSGLFGERIES